MTGNAETLLAAARRLQGATGWRPGASPAALVAALNAAEPRFGPAIRALGGALALGPEARLRPGSIEADVERLAGDVVLLEAVPIAQARAGAVLAARLLGHDGVAMPEIAPEAAASINDSWLGASAIPAASPTGAAATAGAAPAMVALALGGRPLADYLKDKRVLAGIAAAVAIGIWSSENAPPPAPGPTPGPMRNDVAPPPPPQPQPQTIDGPPTPPPTTDGPPGPPPAPPPQAGGGQAPVLVDPQSGQALPQLAIEDGAQAIVYHFALPGSKAPFPAALVVSKSGAWSSGQVMIFGGSSGQTLAVSEAAPFQLSRTENGVQRMLATDRWLQNEAGITDICVLAARQGGEDVPPRGFNLCVLTAQCGSMVGCGIVP